jgi:hypothetical protein
MLIGICVAQEDSQQAFAAGSIDRLIEELMPAACSSDFSINLRSTP